MKQEHVFLSCCYSEGRGDYYLKYMQRLEKSLERYAPDKPFIGWSKGWPPQSPSHCDLHYGFKYYAVKHAVESGYRFPVWLDAGCEAIGPLDPIYKHLEEEGVLILTGGDVLGEWISDQALAHFNVTRDYAMGLKLAGGCIVGLDMQNPKAQTFYAWWGELAKTKLFMGAHAKECRDSASVMRSILVADDNESIIISQDPRVKGHRSDEACYALMIDRLGVKPFLLGEWQSIMRTY